MQSKWFSYACTAGLFLAKLFTDWTHPILLPLNSSPTRALLGSFKLEDLWAKFHEHSGVECLQKAPLYEICMWHISTCENQWLFCSLSKCVNINLSVELHRTTFLQCVVAVSSVWRHLKEIGSWIGAPDVQYIKDQHSVFPVPTYCCWFWLLYVAGIYHSYRQFMQ